MTPDNDDLLAYLLVLNSPKVHLSGELESKGNCRIMGCLGRAIDFLEQNNPELAKEIIKREQINGRTPYGDSALQIATDELAPKIYEHFLKGTNNGLV